MHADEIEPATGVNQTAVLIVDDHHLVAELLRAALVSQNNFRVDIVSDVESALVEIEQKHKHYDVILLDYQLPGTDGLIGMRQLIEASKSNVVLFSGCASSAVIDRAFEYGSKGYIPKTVHARAIGHAIRLVADGEVFIPSDYIRNGKQAAVQVSNLKPRELSVLEFLSMGLPNKEISRLLDLEEWTVKMDVKSICRKLNASNRTQAVILAKKAGLV
jgi:DNA-binding NarL/FixJ family response regulator